MVVISKKEEKIQTGHAGPRSAFSDHGYDHSIILASTAVSRIVTVIMCHCASMNVAVTVVRVRTSTGMITCQHHL